MWQCAGPPHNADAIIFQFEYVILLDVTYKIDLYSLLNSYTQPHTHTCTAFHCRIFKLHTSSTGLQQEGRWVNNLWEFTQIFNTNMLSFLFGVQERRKPTLYYEGRFVALLVQSLLCVDFSLTSIQHSNEWVHKCMILT